MKAEISYKKTKWFSVPGFEHVYFMCNEEKTWESMSNDLLIISGESEKQKLSAATSLLGLFRTLST